jgi:RimJ/RimL family protein N-acetyltransferase
MNSGSPSPSLFAYKVVGMKKEQTLTLPSGVEIPFRVIRPEDAPALQRLHGRCSERTIYLRFFGPMKKLSDEKARYFASTDGVDHFGLVALDPQDQNEIIGVVRYARTPDDERAEYAALVEDRWQGEGVGADLTRRLIDEARDNGVRFFYALIMGENKRMLNVLRHLDLPEQERREDGAKRVEVRLSS